MPVGPGGLPAGDAAGRLPFHHVLPIPRPIRNSWPSPLLGCIYRKTGTVQKSKLLGRLERREVVDQRLRAGSTWPTSGAIGPVVCAMALLTAVWACKTVLITIASVALTPEFAWAKGGSPVKMPEFAGTKDVAPVRMPVFTWTIVVASLKNC